MIKDSLKKKLREIGYSDEAIDKHIDEVDFKLLLANDNANNNDIEIIKYDSPNASISRVLLNVDSKFLNTTLIDGDCDIKTMPISTGGRMQVADYRLDKPLCIVLITDEFKVEIVYYSPSSETIAEFEGQSYDEAYSQERNDIIKDYYDEFISSNKLTQGRAKEVLNMLASDFVIDEMVIENKIPVLKLYNAPENFAEKITNYELKYINRRLNRIEIAEKSALIKRVSKNVKAGYLSNDPYIKLNDVNKYPEFYLNKIAYFWIFANERGQEEIGIYSSNIQDEILYSESIKKAGNDFDLKAREIAMQFTNQLGFMISESAVKDILFKLNHQLVVPPVETILKYAENSEDPIEPLSYRYKAIVDAEDFESRLYNSIENNIGRRYKYKVAENVLEDLTTIGNKLDYITSDGKSVKKQSIADFNQNGNAVIVRRETLIDESDIQKLLGYIYDDIESKGTDNLPVPSIEVDFYFPNISFGTSEVKMFNGTNYENNVSQLLSGNNFYSIDDVQNVFASKEELEGSTSATVRCVTGKGDVLKENTIKNVFPGDTYEPEIIPIISDKEGREWTYNNTESKKITLSSNEGQNIIELVYVEKTASVTISFINTESKELAHSKKIQMQVGTEVKDSDYLTVKDKEGIEWDLVKPNSKKIVVSEDENKNKIVLMYDVTRVNVVIKYIAKDGITLKDSNTVTAIANKKYMAHIDPILEDSSGLAWVYISNSAASIIPYENTSNEITLVYDELKAKVLTTYKDEKGNSIKDDLVDFIQVGKEYSPKYDSNATDKDGKVWTTKTISKDIIKVKTEEESNVINIIYEPKYSKVTVRKVDSKGKNISNDTTKDMQVGSIYILNNQEKTKDYAGLIWQCSETRNIKIEEDESKNIIILSYEPLFVNCEIRFVDDENEEIIPSKTINIQAGSHYKPDVPAKLEDKQGRRWQAIKTEEKEFIISDHEEENIISIYYEKVLTSIVLSFKDLYANTLQDDVKIEWQIGAEYKSSAYEKIVDKNNARWLRVSSEPKNMVVKEKNNNFILLYDEIRTKVILRYLNISDNTAIKEPDVIITKLGVTYVPNIQKELIDSNKLSWTYVGEKELIITTKEEEQENIITLKYEPHNAKVVVKYHDENGRRIINSNEKDMQVGREVQIKKIEKIYDDNKYGYTLKSIDNTIIRVSEDENKNIVNCIYVPLLSKVVTSYKNQDGTELIKPTYKELQVGTSYTPEAIDKVIDENGKHWNYSNDEIKPIVVTEEEQIVSLNYVPELRKVITKYTDENNLDVINSKEKLVQVGESYTAQIEESISDTEERIWIFKTTSSKEIIVSENDSENEINLKYEKKLVDVVINFINENKQQIKYPEKLREQQGSVLNYQAVENIIDKDGLGWEVNAQDNRFKITENNNFTITYKPYLVNVYERFVNENNEDIIQAVVSKQQVGIKFESNPREFIIDDEGKEWVKHTNSLFNNNSNTIIVSSDESKNNAITKYEPSLTEVTVLYIDPFGNSIKQKSIVKAQIGSLFSADIIERITDTKGNKWTYNPNTKNEVKVVKDGTSISLSYEEQKAIVIFKYQDEYGNRLKTPKKSLAQVGTNYKPEIDSIIEDDQGQVWEYKERDVESIEIKDTEQDNVFILTYVPLKVDVKIYVNDKQGKEIVSPIVVKAPLGSQFTPKIDNNITDEKSLLYKYTSMEPESIKVKETPIGSTQDINVFKLTYEPVYSFVTIRYQDVDGNSLRDEEKKQLQVGEIFKPKISQFIKDRKENQWQLVTNEDLSIRVKENIKENTIKVVYEIAKADVFVRYIDTEGNSIKEDDKYNIQIGMDFVPNAPKYIFDKDNKKWGFFSSEPVKLRVGSINNIVKVSYQEEKATVIIKYRDENGKQLKGDDRVLVQIGTIFKPKVSSKVIYDENEIWKFTQFEPNQITVSENTNENVISQIYTNGEANSIQEDESKEDITSKNEKIEELKNNIVEDSNNIPEENKQEATGYVYKNKNLEKIDNVILLEDSEKEAIEKISELNKELINKAYEISDDSEFSTFATGINEEEKQLINKHLNEIIKNDKTGSKILKILEISLEPSEKKEIFSALQERKAVLMTDYFLNQPLTDNEQAIYICSKGKNEKQIEYLNNMNKNTAGINDLSAQLLYEKSLLENYCRARSEVKDRYFIDENSKEKISTEISTIVSNMLINQTYNLAIKDNIDLYQEVELAALYKLLNQMQRERLEQKINKISDGRKKKSILKKLQSYK